MPSDGVQIWDQCLDGAARPIRGTEGLSRAAIEQAVQAGGRFVFYEYCISLGIVTLRRPSAVYFRRRGRGVLRGLPYTLLSALLGWWGVPWGLVYTPLVLFTNLSGGCDVTAAVLAQLAQTAPQPADAFCDRITGSLEP